MKKVTSVLPLFFVLLFSGCQRSEQIVHEITKPKTFDIQKSLQSGSFKALKSASIIYVRTIKNGSMPVQGSLNINAGRLNINLGATTLLELMVDMTSWDSGLTLRDDRVMQIFFETDRDKNKVALFQVKPIDTKTIEKFKKDKKLNGVKVKGTLKFHGASLPVDAVLNVGFTKNGRLVVTSTKPFAVKISDLKLNEALKKLMIICEHKSVDDVVTLNVHLEFEPLSSRQP